MGPPLRVDLPIGAKAARPVNRPVGGPFSAVYICACRQYRLAGRRTGEERRMSDPVTTAEPAITPGLIAQHGLKPDEYQRILDLIGRKPSFTELGIFSAMWNEHCSYKSSRIHLRTLPTTGACVIQGP